MADEQELRSEGEEINLRKIFAGFISRWYVFAVAMAFFLACGMVYMKLSLPVYRAESSIIVKDNKLAGKNNIEDILTGDLLSASKNLSTEIGIIQSRAMLLEAASTLNLKVSFFGLGTISRIPVYKNIPFKVEFSFIQPFFLNAPFIVTFKDADSFEMNIEIDNKNISDYSYSGKHKLGEKISTQYFSLVSECCEWWPGFRP